MNSAKTVKVRGKNYFVYEGKRYDVTGKPFIALINQLRKAGEHPFTTIVINGELFALNAYTKGKGSREPLVKINTRLDGFPSVRGLQALDAIEREWTAVTAGLRTIQVEPEPVVEQDIERSKQTWLERREFKVNIRGIDHVRNYLQHRSQLRTYINTIPVRFPRFILRIRYEIAVIKPNHEFAYTYHMWSDPSTILTPERLMQVVDGMFTEFTDKLAALSTVGSGMMFVALKGVTVHISRYEPIRGSSYVPLPKDIQSKKAVINVKNTDNRCFMWAVLSALHPADSHSDRVSNYSKYADTLKFEGIDFPVAVKDIPKFESQNRITVNVYGLDEKHKVFPLHINTAKTASAVNLLLFNNHYCNITSLNRLLCFDGHHQRYFCPVCLHGYTTQELLNEHVETGYCVAQRVKLPKEGDVSKFNKHKALIKHPFVIYADFESALVKPDGTAKTANTSTLQEHKPIAVAAYLVSHYGEVKNRFWMHVGEDSHIAFIDWLDATKDELSDALHVHKKAIYTDETRRAFAEAKTCWICGDALGTTVYDPFKDYDEGVDTRFYKAYDHDHFTGLYRGAAHVACNIKVQVSYDVPVVFHNFKGYDSHHIMNALATREIDCNELNAIPTSSEKFMTLSWKSKVCDGTHDPVNFKYRFIDSFAFLSSSLDKLASSLAPELKKHTRARYPEDDKFEVMCKKGFFPYDHLTGMQSLDATALPSFDTVKKGVLGAVDRKHYDEGVHAWNTFKCKTFRDYMEIYLTADVHLLADVFENFRCVAMNDYGLDPVHFTSLPGYAWEAMLKKTGAKIELISDNDMLLMWEQGKRGGMSFIGHRYAKANNKYVGEYDESKPTSFLSYFDANNLYGAAMIKKLPTGGYRWSRMTAEELLAVDADGDIGNLVEVDLEYPKELHATHSMYPLAPVRRRILAEELSPYSASFGVESKVEKLVTTLEDKKHYVCHIKNLQQYCKLGMKITAVHRVIEFEQAAWLAPYIEFNTKKRTATKDDFEKDFYKLMNNAVFGKTMENVRNRKAMKFFDTQDKRIQKYTARPTYGGIFHNIGDRMVALEIQSSEVSMDKPIAVGITVLELSKTIMYNFHYNIMIPRYGANNLKLCMTDTDSLFYHIQCEDVYRDMSELRQHFDLSDFPKDHPCYDATNKKVIGKFKDESSEHAIQEFVGLRSKLYAYKTADKESKRCKGISKEVVKKDICFNDYYYTLMSGTSLSKNVRGIVSKDHKLITYETKKSALAAFDDKRFYLNNIESVPYGY